MEPPIPYTGSKRLWAKELATIAETLPKRASMGHNVEWLAGNPAAVKLGIKPALFA